MIVAYNYMLGLILQRLIVITDKGPALATIVAIYNVNTHYLEP